MKFFRPVQRLDVAVAVDSTDQQRPLLVCGSFGVEDAKGPVGYIDLMRTPRTSKSHAVTVLADLSGLSASTIRRDLKLGHLNFDLGGRSASDEEIERWLIERRERCGGLTVKGNDWLWS